MLALEMCKWTECMHNRHVSPRLVHKKSKRDKEKGSKCFLSRGASFGCEPRKTVTCYGFPPLPETPPLIESGHKEIITKTLEMGAQMCGFSALGIPVPSDPHYRHTLHLILPEAGTGKYSPSNPPAVGHGLLCGPLQSCRSRRADSPSTNHRSAASPPLASPQARPEDTKQL